MASTKEIIAALKKAKEKYPDPEEKQAKVSGAIQSMVDVINQGMEDDPPVKERRARRKKDPYDPIDHDHAADAEDMLKNLLALDPEGKDPKIQRMAAAWMNMGMKDRDAPRNKADLKNLRQLYIDKKKEREENPKPPIIYDREGQETPKYPPSGLNDRHIDNRMRGGGYDVQDKPRNAAIDRAMRKKYGDDWAKRPGMRRLVDKKFDKKLSTSDTPDMGVQQPQDDVVDSIPDRIKADQKSAAAKAPALKKLRQDLKLKERMEYVLGSQDDPWEWLSKKYK